MIRLLARLHGVGESDQPDFGQDMPGLVKGGTVIGLLTSAVVVAHLAALGVGGAALFLRNGDGYTRGETTMLAVLAIVAVLAFSVVALVRWSSQHGKLAMRDRVVSDLQLRGDEQVLDVGCGNGLLLIGLAGSLTTGSATGADLWRDDLESNNSAASVRDNALLAGVADRVVVETADAKALPFDDGSFDVVASSFMLHHMTAPQRGKAVSEMMRCLKPGGTLVLIDVAHMSALRGAIESEGAADVRQDGLGLPFYKRLVATK